jgi:pyrimidine operon attenuation protein/uracil phosphoribosyltransferase
MKKQLTSEQVEAALNGLYQAVASQLPEDSRVAVIGIRSRGETLARRLVARLREEQPNLKVDLGVLDITFYRDDLSRHGGTPVVRATEIDFDLNGAWVLLVDDVLETGRSVRAGLDALADFGRPRVVRLAVLIDRGGRELPIAADFVGKKLRVSGTEKVQVKLKENDGEEGVFISPSR